MGAAAGAPGCRRPDAGPLLAWLGEWGAGIAEHHERYDGSGYPRGLAGLAISRAGRALAVVDAYEVMTAARSYKRPMHVGTARLELARCAGTHFDPAMVRAFLAISLPRLLWTTGPLSFLANLPLLDPPSGRGAGRPTRGRSPPRSTGRARRTAPPRAWPRSGARQPPRAWR